MTKFTDPAARAPVQQVCDKRNASILRTHPMRWMPLYDPAIREWKPRLVRQSKLVTPAPAPAPSGDPS